MVTEMKANTIILDINYVYKHVKHVKHVKRKNIHFEDFQKF